MNAALWHQVAQAVTHHALFPLFLTLAAYACGAWLFKRSGNSPLMHPLVMAVAIVIVLLKLLGLSYQDYFHATQFLHWALGPAIVALAIPLYGELRQLGARWRSLMAGLVVGSVVSVVSAMSIVLLMGGGVPLAKAMSTKSVTTALAMVLAQEIGASAAIASTIVLVTGLLGAMIGPWLLPRLAPGDDAAHGMAYGTCAHAIGTSKALQISETCGAFSALAMGMNGLLTALLLPLLLAWWGH